jgi:hypothetical protein
VILRVPVVVKVPGRAASMPVGSEWRVTRTNTYYEPGGIIGETVPEWSFIEFEPIGEDMSDRPPKPPTKRCQKCSDPVLYPGKDWSEFCANHSRDTDDPAALAVMTSMENPSTPRTEAGRRLHRRVQRFGLSMAEIVGVREMILNVEHEAYMRGWGNGRNNNTPPAWGNER